MPGMRRREFVSLLGGAAVAWPLAARAQQPAMPVIGFLSGISAGERPHLVESFRRGLSETGYVAGQNVAIEFRYAENQPDRLPALAADLIARRVAVIAATGGTMRLWSRNQRQRRSRSCSRGRRPGRAGLVSSFSQPGGNITGVSWFSVDLGAKHLELVHEVVPAATLIAVLVNPRNREAALYEQPLRAAARVPGLQLEILKASTADEIDAAFETLVQLKASAVIVASDPFLTLAPVSSRCWRRDTTLRWSVAPATSRWLAGMMSYGTTPLTRSAAPDSMPVASSRARSRLICRSSRPPSSS